MYFLATFSTKPIPVVPAKNSAATSVPQQTPTATLMPVNISGSELGKITFINSQTAQQLIYASKDGKEFCFPWHNQFIKNIDTKKGIMEVEIPKEFLDLN